MQGPRLVAAATSLNIEGINRAFLNLTTTLMRIPLALALASTSFGETERRGAGIPAIRCVVGSAERKYPAR
jgi:hypothetical protein